jgi:hypothetical protein
VNITAVPTETEEVNITAVLTERQRKRASLQDLLRDRGKEPSVQDLLGDRGSEHHCRTY